MTQARDDWRVRTPIGEVTIEVHPEEGLDAAEHNASVLAIEQLLYGFRFGDREARRVVFEIHARLRGLSPDSVRGEAFDLDTGSVRAQMVAEVLLDAARTGTVTVRPHVARSVIVPLEVVAEQVLGPSSVPPEAELSWIAIELVGEDGKPIPYQAYQVTLPDGTTRSGQLDNTGKAMERNIPAGQCGVSFPDLDQATWAPA